MREPDTPVSGRKHILFVDDEENVLTGLKRIVRAMRHEWSACYASSGQQALQLLDEQPFDVLVTDMRMPGMDGAELLSEVSREFPQMIRILLSGQCDLESFIGSACPAHQLLGKPCEADALKRTIARVLALRGLLNDETLRGLVMQMNTLPSPPTMYLRIEQELERPDSSMQRIGEMIGADIGMTAKLLQLVNSPFFGFNRSIETPAQAAAMLGVNMVQFIMLHVQTFAVTDPHTEHVVAQISGHCMQVATLARAIARQAGADQQACLDAYLGGMMHDLGRLIVAVNMADQYTLMQQQAADAGLPMWQVELKQMGVSHAAVGAYLIGLWGLPEQVVEIAHYHHTPGDCGLDDFLALAAVHIADVLLHNPELEDTGQPTVLDRAYLDRLGLNGHEAEWQACLQRMLEQG